MTFAMSFSALEKLWYVALMIKIVLDLCHKTYIWEDDIYWCNKYFPICSVHF
jgi:hypothetical protein